MQNVTSPLIFSLVALILIQPLDYSNVSYYLFLCLHSLFIPYGTGFVLGYLGNDTVTFGGVPVAKTTFGEAIYMASFFSQVPIDGILGLAFPAIASDGVVPVLDRMYQEKLIPNFMFSTYLASKPGANTSVLILGGTDSTYYTGEIKYIDVLTPSYWLIGSRGAAVNGKRVNECTGDDVPPYGSISSCLILFCL